MLPKILQPVARQADDEQPWRSRHRSCGDDYEHRRDTALNSDNRPASIGDREADVERGNQYQTEGVDRRRIEPPEGERRGGLDSPEDKSPDSGCTHRLLGCSER